MKDCAVCGELIFQLVSYARHRPWCLEFNAPGDCTCGLYALLDSIRCTCGHKVSVQAEIPDSDIEDRDIVVLQAEALIDRMEKSGWRLEE